MLRQAATGDSSSIGSVQRRIDQILDLRKPNPPRTSVRPTTPAPPITLTRLEKARLKKQKRRAKRLQSSPEELPTRKVRKGPRIWHPGRLLTPLLASANGFPLLRHRGTPTPQHVAMTIKNLIKVRQKRQDLQDVLYEHLEYAHGEDTWDQEVFKHTGESGDEFIGPGEGTWADQVKASLRYLSDAIGRRDQRSKQLGDLFWDIEMRMIQKKERIIRARATERRKRARHSRGRRKNLAKQLKEEQIDG